jgi:hypothetical protein
LTSVTIPNGVTSIGDFSYCTTLTNVSLPNSVTSIGSDAFAFCASLTSITIPDSVTTIGDGAFMACSLNSVTIPNNVNRIGDWAFSFCYSLTNVFFDGNAPEVGEVGQLTTFLADPATVYYLPGTTGWTTSFAGMPTATRALPNPLILKSSLGFVGQPSQFGFSISWATNLDVVVEASTSPGGPLWQPLQTNTLVGGTSYFGDPQWTNYPRRFYRVRSH